jgi:hypothetical protein
LWGEGYGLGVELTDVFEIVIGGEWTLVKISQVRSKFKTYVTVKTLALSPEHQESRLLFLNT